MVFPQVQGLTGVEKDLQDKALDEQTESPTFTRPGFRMTCQFVAKKDLYHLDLNTVSKESHMIPPGMLFANYLQKSVIHHTSVRV